MKLSVLERLILANVLPKEGDVLSLRIVRQLREELSFSEEEHEKLQFKNTDGMLQWDADALEDKEISIGAKATQLIKDSLKSMNDSKTLTQDHLPVWDKFMGEEED